MFPCTVCFACCNNMQLQPPPPLSPTPDDKQMHTPNSVMFLNPVLTTSLDVQV